MSKNRQIGQYLAEFYRMRLTHSDPAVVKHTLEELCYLKRNGWLLRPVDRNAIEHVVSGLFPRHRTNQRLVMWAVNFLILYSPVGINVPEVRAITQRPDIIPELFISCLAYLYRFDDQGLWIESQYGDSAIDLALARSRVFSAKRAGNSELSIDIEKATIGVLQGALVGIGTDVLPPSVLHPKYAYDLVIGELVQHDNPRVRQYSLWAVTENDNLSWSNTRLKAHELFAQPSNVRRWGLRLFAQEQLSSPDGIDGLAEFARDPDAESREGLALGLPLKSIDGADLVLSDWYMKEEDESVQNALLRHIGANALQNAGFQEITIQAFRASGEDSPRRALLYEATKGTRVYTTLREEAYRSESGTLNFGNMMGTNVTNITVNGNIQGGAVSVGSGTVNVSGSVWNSHTGLSESIREASSEVEASKVLNDTERQDLLADLRELAAADDLPKAKTKAGHIKDKGLALAKVVGGAALGAVLSALANQVIAL